MGDTVDLSLTNQCNASNRELTLIEAGGQTAKTPHWAGFDVALMGLVTVRTEQSCLED